MMGTRIGVLLGLLLWLCSLPYRTMAIDALDMPAAAPTPVPGSVVQTDGLGVRLLSHHGEWTSFFSMNGGAEPIFLISGQLENTAGKPLSYVKLQFELLGEDEVVVFRDHGYNRKAEALRDEVYEAGQKALADMEIEEIGVGAREEFRFIFFKGDAPEFRSYRIRVIGSQ